MTFPPEGYVALDETNNVYKKIDAQGTPAAEPMRVGSTVRVHYTGSLFSDGMVFDSSRDRDEPLRFKIGKGMVVKGWDVGIASMNVGERAKLLIRPEYGYGKEGSPPKIPGDATLLFDVELVSVDISTADMSIDERIAKATSLKEQGNAFFKAANYSEALTAYTNSANILADTFGCDQEQGAIVTELKVSVNSNLAAVCLKLNDGKAASEYSQKVLDIDPSHSKALFRKFQAGVLMGQYEESIEFIEKNREILGKEINIDQEILKAKKSKAKALADEKKLYAKMFSS